MSDELLAWRERAACAGKQDLFFSDHMGSLVKKAKAICEQCQVLEECRAYALSNTEYGVWGGMTANERRKYLRKHRLMQKYEVQVCTDSV
jgi:WhiB family redox-sensing transcriptional regulator